MYYKWWTIRKFDTRQSYCKTKVWRKHSILKVVVTQSSLRWIYLTPLILSDVKVAQDNMNIPFPFVIHHPRVNICSIWEDNKGYLNQFATGHCPEWDSIVVAIDSWRVATLSSYMHASMDVAQAKYGKQTIMFWKSTSLFVPMSLFLKIVWQRETESTSFLWRRPSWFLL